MDFLSQYGLFLAKIATTVIAILIIVSAVLSIRRKSPHKIQLHSLSDEYREMTRRLEKDIYAKKLPSRKQKKQLKAEEQKKANLYVLDFNGDIKASQADGLRQAVTAILSIIQAKDEVLVRLESPGGSVNGYGLAASQLQRLRDRNIPITVCIDKMAASGGYLMACVAHTITAAPFAIIGSIGVVAQLPNFHRWLKKHNIDVELLTAGEYKRTLTVFGENTPKDRKKFQEDLEQIHTAFRDYVSENRQQINIDEVATGEHWLASDAFRLKLIDTLQTSDDCIIDKMKTFKVWRLSVDTPTTLVDKILKPAAKLLHPWA
ncbi:MAG: protease SohB [Legionellaceae bacterium]|nr:protease SohB [Legionellaceae bacterium]